jgi:two-component system sensor histidine kinase DegS
LNTKYQHQAAAIVTEQAERLRSVLTDAQARLAPATLDLRQVARTLDELQIRNTQRESSPILARQIKQLQERHSMLEVEVAELQRVTHSIEQLIRQIEMSGTVLKSQGAQVSPWELALKAQVIQGREDERARLAREVHDGPAQVLAHVLIYLEHSITLAQQRNGDRLLELLHMLRDNSRSGLHEIRRFIADLRPPTLEQHGLDAALRELCDRAGASGNIEVQYDPQLLPRLTPEHEIVIYRVAQEALANAAKHAGKATVRVSTYITDEHLALVVHDNGPGFDSNTVAARVQGRHWGLASMRERAALIGAQLTVTSPPGQGTEVRLQLARNAPGMTCVSEGTDQTTRVGG